MSNPRSDELVREYLRRLDSELEHTPRAHREMLRDQLVTHISDARAELDDDSPERIASILEDLGDPSQIVGGGTVRPAMRGRRSRMSTWGAIGVVGAIAVAALAVALGNGNSAAFTKIPIVTGDPLGTASEALHAVGLKLGASYVLPSAVVPVGDVVATNPKGGSRVRSGSKVQLAISQGPSVMPEVVGLTARAAVRELRDRNLRAVVVRIHSSNSSGVVVGQTPARGTTMISGTWVRIDVASNSTAVPSTVPNVVGEPTSYALAELRSLGLRLRIRIYYRQVCGIVSAETLPGIPVPRGGVYVGISECERQGR
jgi:hypothetical protein